MTSTPSSAPVVILSCSLNPHSRSHKLALAAESFLRTRELAAELIDLNDYALPLCGAAGSFDHPSAKTLLTKIEAAASILISSPIYNYDLNAVAKNVMELTGAGWKEKPVGFLCTAGGQASYMSPVGFANSLMFDFRCHVIPRFVYCTKVDFTDDGDLGPELTDRVHQLAAATVDLARALAWVREHPTR